MARSKPIPRGIKEIDWRNTLDNSTSRRYRVRLVRAAEDFKLDRLCDTLDAAIRLLDDARTPEGRARINSGTDADALRRAKKPEGTAEEAALDEQDVLIGEWMRDKFAGKFVTIGEVVEHYIRDNLTPKTERATFPDVRENERKRALSAQIRLRKAMATPLPYLPPEAPAPFTREWEKHQRGRKPDSKLFGDWPLSEVNHKTGYAYIEERAKPYYCERKKREHVRALSSIKREMSELDRVMRQLEFADPHQWALLGEKNPLAGSAKKFSDPIFAGRPRKAKKRWRMLSIAEEAAILSALGQPEKNPELAQIFNLSMATGMRLSECVLLEWSYINLASNAIHLPDEAVKTQARRVLIDSHARSIIEAIPRKPRAVRVFSYTVEGFQTVFGRITDALGIKDFRNHDMRRTYISRQMALMASPVAIALAAGIKDVEHLERGMMKDILDDAPFQRGSIQNENELRASVAHRSAQMTHSYASTEGQGGPEEGKA
ncbi:hypothetical protein [Janthinobacterium sp. PSPC3-1]|uniref:hypothetical protein n=1 Tax=Janthinobacterium sp. PSPC3-1 TaxID=2804653 RepID=UPI003CEEBEA1